jgi:DNA-binding CsgD family transcriptional regulator
MAMRCLPHARNAVDWHVGLGRMSGRFKKTAPIVLTAAEVRVLRLIAEGNSNKEIAAPLSSLKTRSRAR